ncbi:MAG: NAD(P)H:quinone oxidoreductase [Promethearchaeota archaeon]|nr:MAG: NAD(P)H:quinone oxidoreductase [Candidatus Lokiarchaeota archaeon]
MAKILVLFYSTYGHIYQMATAVAAGIEQVAEVKAIVKRVPETISEDILKSMGAFEAQKAFQHIPVASPQELGDYDGIIFGTPTRFGNMAGQMKNFLDQTGMLWQKGALIGKVAGVFVSAANQHGGLESTILSFHIPLLHHGMLIAGLPYSFQGQMGADEIKGGSPYGASTIADKDGSRMPSQMDLDGARFQGNYIAGIVKMLV